MCAVTGVASGGLVALRALSGQVIVMTFGFDSVGTANCSDTDSNLDLEWIFRMTAAVDHLHKFRSVPAFVH